VVNIGSEEGARGGLCVDGQDGRSCTGRKATLLIMRLVAVVFCLYIFLPLDHRP
jgi:hypothetical protein